MKKNTNPKRTKKVEMRDQFTVVLESIESKVDGIAEGVMMANERIDRYIKENQKSFNTVNENLKIMRTEISLIRHNQVSNEEPKNT